MSNDGRRDKRVPIGIKVRFKSATIYEFIEHYSRDISKGGIFIRTDSPMPVGTLIKFDLRLQNDSTLIQGVGRVVWRRDQKIAEDSPAGMGIKFIKLDEASRNNLDRIVGSRKLDSETSDDTSAMEKAEQLPSTPPEGIEPVRPQSIPPGTKREISGASPSIQPSNISSEESDSSVDDTEEEVSDVEEEVSTDNLQNDTKRDDGILKDISSAIDDALDFDKDGDPSEDATADQETPVVIENVSDESEIVDEKPEKEEEKDDEKTELESLESEEKVDEEKSIDDGKETSKVIQNEKSGLSPVIWIVLLLVAAGAIYYFGFHNRGKKSQSVDNQTEVEGKAESKQDIVAPTKPVVDEPALAEPEEKPESIVEPEPSKTVAVTVTTIPPGAKIVVNGKPEDGVSPVEISVGIEQKELEIEAKLFGYMGATQKASIAENGPMKVDFKLKPARIKAEIKSTPAGAGLTVNEKWLGRTPRSVTKRGFSAEFSYVLTKPGYEDYTGTATEADWVLDEGVYRLVVDVVLKKIEKEEKPDAEKPMVEEPVAEKPVVEKPVAAKPRARKKKPKPKIEKADETASAQEEKPEAEKIPEKKPESEPKTPKVEKPEVKKPVGETKTPKVETPKVDKKVDDKVDKKVDDNPY